MTHSGLLDREAILGYLHDVAEELPAGTRHTIVVAGGTYLALHGLRAATQDVDSIRRLGPELREAVAAVGVRNGLGTRWLNDSATMFAPQGLVDDLCAVVVRTSTLVVLEPPATYVFAMKLSSRRVADTADLRPLWPLTGFRSADEAVAFMESCYPYLEPDPFLPDFLRQRVIP